MLRGKSYSGITKLTGVPKSTISTWFGKTIRKPWNRKTMLEHLNKIRKSANIALKKKWKEKREQEIQEIKYKIKKDFKNYPKNNTRILKSLLAMLYWSEGSKTKGTMTFVNTDPKLALFYITLLRKCYNIDETKFRIWLRIHYYHSKKKSKRFWSQLLNVPINQFYKISIKKRGKSKRFRKNFAGMCSIKYNDNCLKKELMELYSYLDTILT